MWNILEEVSESSVVQNLRQMGASRSSQASYGDEGEVEIVCPFCHAPKARYYLPRKESPYGEFCCPDCPERTLGDLLEAIGLEPYEARVTPRFFVDEGILYDQIVALEETLAKRDVYTLNGRLVRMGISEKPVVMTFEDTALYLSSELTWLMRDKRSTPPRVREVDPPRRLVKALLGLSEHPKLPALVAYSRHPLLDERGCLVDPGYWPSKQIYLSYDPAKFSMFSQVTKEEAQESLSLIEEFLSEFLFQNPQDSAAAISAVLTAVIRPLLPAAPLFAAVSSLSGAGKSCLSEVLAAIASGSRGASVTLPKTEVEMQKLLLAALSAGPQVLYFDNVTELEDFPSLCTVLTQGRISGRELGKSQVMQADTRCFFLASGNWLEIPGDLRRRVIPIVLDAPDKPEQRTFRVPDLVEAALDSRPQLVVAALKIMSYSRTQNNLNLRPIAGYTTWSEFCREPLIRLGLPEPATRLFQNLSAEDPQRSRLRRLYQQIEAVFGQRQFTSKSIQVAAQKNEALSEVLEELEVLTNGRKLGRLLSKMNTYCVGGYQLQRLETYVIPTYIIKTERE